MPQILFLFLLTLSSLAIGQSVTSTEELNARLEEHRDHINEKYNFYDDYIKISTIPYRQHRKGYPEVKRSFQTMALKVGNKEKTRNSELIEIHQELDYLILNKPETIRFPLHSTIFEIECSYLGNVIRLRLYEGMDSKNSKAKQWLSRARDLHYKVFTSIVMQAAPYKFKNERASDAGTDGGKTRRPF